MAGPAQWRVQMPASGAAAWAFCALALMTWWMRAPYPGLARDAEFYALDALRHADPGFLAGDPYFAHGTQGRYSLFIAPYAALAQQLGIQVAAVLTTVTLRLLWLAGAWQLLRRLAPRGHGAVWGLGAICLVEGVYHPLGVFRFGEPFATPRLAAEAVSLFALAALLGGRRARALGLAALATALHPLLGWPALALVLVMPQAGTASTADAARPTTALARRITLAAGAVTIAALAAALAGLPIAERLLQRYDPAWWAWVEDRNAITVIQAWPWLQTLDLLAALPLLALSAHGHSDAAARLARATTILALLALTVWLLGCASHAVLPIQLQPWRVLWLVQWLAAGLWALRLADAPPRAIHTQIQATLLLAMVVAPAGWSWPLVGLLALRLGAEARLDARLAPARQRAIGVAVLLLWTVPAALPTGGLLAWGPDLADRLQAPLVAVAGIPARRLAVCLLGALAAGWLTRRARTTTARTRWIAPGAALVATGCTLALWLTVARDAWAPPAAWLRVLQQEIPPGTVVHWDQRARVTWFELQRPAWLVSEHGAPLLFFRGLAMTWDDRIRRARALDLDIPSIRRTRGGDIVTGTQALDLARARGLCADPQLGVVLLEGRVTGADRVLSLPARAPLSLVDCARHRLPSVVPGSS